ncbi:MAG TPA: hypothetical protein PL182_03375 [Pseudobdellovibrionaceae bacterium]|nr:hypothetical protein [Pseudobdellovibrionaceae bacterium]
MAKNALLLLSVIFLFAPAHAEYRVFLLKIEKQAPSPGQASLSPDPSRPARFVESTLDPEQYRGYHPVAPDEVVTYVDTWRCRGRTDRRPLCPNPRGPAGEPAE